MGKTYVRLIRARTQAATRRASAVANVMERLEVIAAIAADGHLSPLMERRRQAEQIVDAVLALTHEGRDASVSIPD